MIQDVLVQLDLFKGAQLFYQFPQVTDFFVGFFFVLQRRCSSRGVETFLFAVQFVPVYRSACIPARRASWSNSAMTSHGLCPPPCPCLLLFHSPARSTSVPCSLLVSQPRLHAFPSVTICGGPLGHDVHGRLPPPRDGAGAGGRGPPARPGRRTVCRHPAGPPPGVQCRACLPRWGNHHGWKPILWGGCRLGWWV